MVSGGSPRGARSITDNQEALAALFQRGVSVGLANAHAATHAQSLPTTTYGSSAYSLYSPYSQSQYGPYVSSAAAVDYDTSSNLYTPPVIRPMNQMQYPSAPPQYIQHPQCHQPAPPTRGIYQWPLATGSSKNNNETAPIAPAATSEVTK